MHRGRQAVPGQTMARRREEHRCSGAAHRGTDGCARPLSVAASRSKSSSAFQPAMRRSDSAFTATARPSSSSACPRARRPRG